MKNVLIIFLVFYSTILNKVYSQWSDVSLGTNSAVVEFYVDSARNLLFVGGQFSTAGGKNINSIATWDGSEWNAFGNNEVFSSHGPVSAIVNFNGSIIVGGDFDSIGMTRVNNIARWNGSSWEPMGDGFDRNVSDLKVYKNELYATGSFGNSGSDLVDCCAKWNGIKWVRISQLIGYGYSFSIYQGKLIIAGSFYHPGIFSILNIIGWDGIREDTTFGVFNDAIFKIRNFGDTLFAVGSFTGFSLNPSNYISIYYNQSWHSIGYPTGGQNWILDVLNYNSNIYLCGYFTNPPDLCRYNGSGFDSVANALGDIQHLIEYKGSLYAGGLFSQINGENIKNIARYNDDGNSIDNNINSNNDNCSIYPNPCYDGKYQIFLNENINIKTILIEIYSIEGKIIYSSYFNKINALR